MKKSVLFWLGLLSIFVALFAAVFATPVVNYGGDIVEYHGITETILKSKTLRLTPIAEESLKTYMPAGYFNNPGYYIKGTDGNRYPSHFIFFSLLALPVRIILHFFSINELQTLKLTNVILFGAGAFFIIKYLLPDYFKRTVFLITTLLSPLLFFFTWPGPDLYYLTLLLIALFLFSKKKYFAASAAVAFASWHSQPLLILSVLIAGFWVGDYYIRHKKNFLSGLNIIKIEAQLLALSVILAIPIIYNLIIFGSLSPWGNLQDGWTIIYGFGLHNISLQKLFEQFFDLNLGIFWYFPVVIIFSLYSLIRHGKSNTEYIFLSLFFLITCFFYQTNPAWHYGTAGFGPSRHAIFLIPLFIFLFTIYIKPKKLHYLIILFMVATQIFILRTNGFINPNLANSFQHSMLSTFVINNYPKFYNPTPEIFVDRTNHTDITNPTSAIYLKDGVCKKAYILKSDVKYLTDICGPLPAISLEKLDDDLLRKSNVARDIKTTEATFWPDPTSCSKEYIGPYICMLTENEFSQATGIPMPNTRVKNLDTGVWRLNTGSPVAITVPPGYFIQYYSFEGTYITY